MVFLKPKDKFVDNIKKKKTEKTTPRANVSLSTFCGHRLVNNYRRGLGVSNMVPDYYYGVIIF